MNCTGNENCTSATTTQPIKSWHVICTAILAAIGICVNVVTLAVLLKSKKMTGPCFMLIAGGSVGSLLLALTFFWTTVVKLGHINNLWSLKDRYRGTCLLINLYALGCFAFPYNNQTVALVALDRFFSTLAPIRYRNSGKRHAVVGLSIAFCSSLLIAAIIIYAGGPLLDAVVPSCTSFADGLGLGPFKASNYINTILSTFSVMCYLAIFIGAYVHKRRTEKKTNGGFATAAEHHQFLRQHAVITPAAKMLSILYVITALAPYICYNFIENSTALYRALGPIAVSATYVEFISLALRCKPFREGLVQLFHVKRG